MRRRGTVVACSLVLVLVTASAAWASLREKVTESVSSTASPPGLTVSPAYQCSGSLVVPLSITPTLTVTDGSEVLDTLLISDVPAGATLSAGTDQGGGTWQLSPSQLTGLTITVPSGTPTFSLSVQASEAKTTVLLPQADSYVDGNNPNSNFGSSGALQVWDNQWDSYLRFDLSSLPPGTVVADAAFSIIFYNGWAYGGDGNHYLYFVPDDTWSESGITWNNRPAFDTPYLGYWWPWNNFTPRYWTFSVQVGPTVQAKLSGDQLVSFCIHNGGVPGYSGYYYSRESGSTNSPKLTVNYNPAYTTTSLTVTAVPLITLTPGSGPLPNGLLGGPYSPLTITASGGTGAFSFSTNPSSLPPGMSLSSAGVLSGTPNALGTYNFTVTATDAQSGCTGAASYTLTVQQYDLSFQDDYGRSVLCVNSATGAWQWMVMKGNGAGNTYTGPGSIFNGSGYQRLVASPGSGFGLVLIYYTAAHRATATFTYRPDAVSSALYDANTLDDEATCGEVTQPTAR